MGSPHSSQNLWLSPPGSSLRARATASSIVLSICCCTASSFAQPDAMMYLLSDAVSINRESKSFTLPPGGGVRAFPERGKRRGVSALYQRDGRRK